MFWENFNDALACNSYCNFFVFVPQTRVSPGLEAQLRYQPHWAGERNAESDAVLTQPMTTVPQYFQKEAGEKQMLWYFGRVGLLRCFFLSLLTLPYPSEQFFYDEAYRTS